MRKGKRVYHCHGKSKGKLIRKYPSVAAAKRGHRAMSGKRK